MMLPALLAQVLVPGRGITDANWTEGSRVGRVWRNSTG